MAKRRSRTSDEWRSLVELFDSSDAKAVDFAAAHDVDVKTLRWWRSRLRGETKAPKFVPVDIAGPTVGRFGRVEARLPSGVVLAFDEFDASTLRDLVAVLGGLS